jgi:PAS domain S-box-containing protein
MQDIFVEALTMVEGNTKNQSRLSAADLNLRNAFLEEKLLEKERSEKALQNSEMRYRRLFESAKDGILILEAETGRVVDVNPFLTKLLGYPYDALCGKFIWEIGSLRDIAASKEAFKKLQENRYIRYEDLPLATSDGRLIAVEFVSNVYLVDHSRVIQCNIRDITARKQAEAERKRLVTAIEQAGESFVIADAEGIIQFVNPAFERTTGYAKGEVIGRNARILKSDKQDELFCTHLWEILSGGGTWAGRMVNKRQDGTLYTAEATISPVHDVSRRIVNYVGVMRDITEQIRLAAQFQQAQKMEAVGLLAGGVAHDYNNMLGVILGYTEMAMMKVDPSQPLRADLKEIIKAVDRSTNITRQLLAFARKQTISPVTLELNQGVESMLKMLRRLIGENIELAWRPAHGLWATKMDPVQIDQILANLCLNARDAIADVGKITIETGNATIDEAYCSGHAGFVAGEYVMLSVGDDGRGIDKENLDRVFEPFFTSKEVGQGTGLGLSTVYGIVKQNQGFINVYSEPEMGTVFKIYLPRCPGHADVIRREEPVEIPQSRGETVLLVDDEPAILKMGKTMLEELGYRVLAAVTPGDAVKLAEEQTNEEIDLLITDVVMPEMNGRDLAKRLLSLHPNIRHLFMSGYTANVIARRGVLEEGLDFIQKPFSMRELAIKVHGVLRREVSQAARIQ